MALMERRRVAPLTPQQLADFTQGGAVPLRVEAIPS